MSRSKADAIFDAFRYRSLGFSADPEIINGVRASSIKIESTSSIMQKLKPRNTSSSLLYSRQEMQQFSINLQPAEARRIPDIVLLGSVFPSLSTDHARAEMLAA
jgi:hypothetical protein